MTAFDALPHVTHQSGESLRLLRSLLLCELADQTDLASECRATANDLTGKSDVDSVLERELAEKSAAHALALVKEVRTALDRLNDRTFGLCEGCGLSIPFERLEVMPYTRRCVHCQHVPLAAVCSEEPSPHSR